MQKLHTSLLVTSALHRHTSASICERSSLSNVDVTLSASDNAQNDSWLVACTLLNSIVQYQTPMRTMVARRVCQGERKLVLVTFSMGLVHRQANLRQKVPLRHTSPLRDAMPFCLEGQAFMTQIICELLLVENDSRQAWDRGKVIICLRQLRPMSWRERSTSSSTTEPTSMPQTRYIGRNLRTPYWHSARLPAVGLDVHRQSAHCQLPDA